MAEDLEIIRLLHDLGFSSKLKGYIYLKCMISDVIINKKCIFKMNDLYKIVSEKYDTSINNVTKCITDAITKAWCNANIDLITKVFGYSIGYENNCPTNSLFVNTVIDYLLGFFRENYSY